MNIHVNPPCNSSLATSFAKSVMASSESRVAALFNEVCQIQRRGNWRLMRLHQGWVRPQLFMLCLACLQLWKKARSVSENLWVLWVARSVLHVILKEVLMTMIVLLTLWAGLLQTRGCWVWGLDFCWCAVTCKLVNGDLSRGCCRHISFAYTWVFFLHSPLAFSLLE